MSEQISWLFEVAIIPGQLDNFRAVAKDLVVSTRQEPGTMAYEWFLTPDHASCHIYEGYKNSAALIAHGESFGPFAERFFQTCRPVRLHVYGTPSAQAKESIAGLNPVYLSMMDGFAR